MTKDDLEERLQDLLGEVRESDLEDKHDAREDAVYEVICKDCGERLDFVHKIDRDGDIIVTVEPCADCKEGE